MLKQKIMEAIEKMEAGDLIRLHNEYCDAVNAYDDNIYSMDDFNLLCSGQTAEWIACRIFYGDFNPNYEYITFNGYGNFKSLDDWGLLDYLGARLDDIADYIARNNDSLYNDDIQDIIDTWEAINAREAAEKCFL